MQHLANATASTCTSTMTSVPKGGARPTHMRSIAAAQMANATRGLMMGAPAALSSRPQHTHRASTVIPRAATVNFITTELDMWTAIKFPITANQPLPPGWTEATPPFSVGPNIRTPMPCTIQFYANHQTGHNQWARASNSTTALTANCPALRFSLRLVTLTGSEAKLELPGGIVLRSSDDGTNAEWGWCDGSTEGQFHALAPSNIRPDCSSHDIILAYAPGSVSVAERGTVLFTHVTDAVGATVAPAFGVQLRDAGASINLEVTSMFLVPGSN